MPQRGSWRLLVAMWMACLPAWAQDAGGDAPAAVKPNPLGVLDTSKFNDKITISPVPELLKGPLPNPGDTEPAPPIQAAEPEPPAVQAGPAPAHPAPTVLAPAEPAPAGPDNSSAVLPTGSVAEPTTTPAPDRLPTAAVVPAPAPEPSPTTVSKDHDRAWAPIQLPIDTVDAQRFRQKARAAIAIGDIAAARALLDGLAARHDPEATFLMAQTYDPEKLSEWGVVGVEGDADRASNYYRRASQGGYPAPGSGSFK